MKHLELNGTVVLSKLENLDPPDRGPEEGDIVAAVVDVETTGLNHMKDEIIQIAIRPFFVSPKTGEVSGLKKTIVALQQPSKPLPNIIKDIISTLQTQVGKKKVILALSGGVDSTVVAALLNKALPKQLTCVFIDTGLMRKDEVKEVQDNISIKLGINLVTVNAKSIFFKKLKGVTSPEKKRKIIGETFIRIFESHSKKLTNIEYLAQGTIYPDVIESSSKDSKSDVIKSHHNVGGLPKSMKFKLVEPIKSLFKDEVRRIGRALKIPKNLIERHPFPGPGLAVRIIGEISEERVNILQEVDHIFIEELHKNNLYNKISQALAVFLPIKSVGVMGDQRQYSYVVVLRAVKTIDFMTASVSEIPYNILNIISTRIVNEVNGVSRVVYDITSKPPGTIEWE